MKLHDLKTQQTAALDSAEAVIKRAEASGSRSLSAVEQAQVDMHMNEAKGLAEKIKAVESRGGLSAKLGVDGQPGFFGYAAAHPEEGQPGASGPRMNGPTTIREAMKYASAPDMEEIKAFARYIGGDMTALADLTPGGDGGVFIPTMVAGVVERAYSAFTPVTNNCRVWPTENGEPTKYPVISDTESAVILAPAALTGADSTVSGDHPPTALGGPTMVAYKFSSLPVFIPRETIADSTLNIMDEIFGALIARILRLQNLKYTKGTGTGEPTGFLTSATAYAAGAVALDLDISLDLAYSVPPLYRPNGIYMASDTTIKYLRKLKTGISGDKRNLWKDVFEEGNSTLGTPAKLHGYPIFVNNDMDSVASDGTFAGVSPLAFGDFQKFVVRAAEMGSPFVYRYTVPAKDGGAVIAFQRSDSKLIVNTAISKLTVS